MRDFHYILGKQVIFIIILSLLQKTHKPYIGGCRCCSFSSILFIKKRGEKTRLILTRNKKAYSFFFCLLHRKPRNVPGQYTRVACSCLCVFSNLDLFSLFFSRKQSELVLWCWTPVENFTKDRFVRFFCLFSELICNETKSAAAANISFILTSVSMQCVPLRVELQHRGRKHTLILAVFLSGSV